ncbi:ATP-dependent DNA helicase RecQ [Rufibacter glacialis]|uniref:ATP-dependent DNA helicase RecQ n=1 Tax=Rufibacter glacialis TaxID=1259555 RepID=A0A5M8QFB1_9BACT|nr:ATP-dependent DNA helicase RecQ [Rufibacter glacialis]KAA6434725.1 RecQ family ATP-dependent DNA helicase [Rufibacter glacialis]GGK71928.1 ATP-dependent DNA helicase RecQ [Rufibacter glacialis]
MADVQDILKQYWGHEAFRPGQEEIITSVLKGQDTLAILPTGGGKSVCFQLPALVLGGVCVVVSPLVALMKDQVENLRKRGLTAAALHAGQPERERDMILDNCVFGGVQFLYVSPERLQTELFLERVKRMNVCLLAVDEAHCISQWGYDFRPPYLEIAKLREVLPDVPVLALTASATQVVKEDIQEKLQFKKQVVVQQSFARKNLSYSVLPTEDKEGRLREILQKMNGTAIVYVRNRRRTVELADWLNRQGIKAAAYHAGLPHQTRASAQTDWIMDRVRVIVATNAFGMGIDKPDVRLVVHLDLPDSLEAYYQEAGRAGRDGKYSYATVLLGPEDTSLLLKKTEEAYPPVETLKRVYQALANFYQLATGSGAFQSFDFDLAEFSRTYQISPIEVHFALKQLEHEGLLQLNEGFYSPSKVYFLLSNTQLYEFQILNENLEAVIKSLLRLYGGEMFRDFVRISEKGLAKHLSVPEATIKQHLQHLHQRKVLVYEPQHDGPQVQFTAPRFDAASLPVDQKRLNLFRERALEKAQAVVAYMQPATQCRTLQILAYFGEISTAPCRICDYCLAQKKKKKLDENKLHMEARVLSHLKETPLHPKSIAMHFSSSEQELLGDLLQEMLESGQVRYTSEGNLKRKEV